jgi:hypothetical protein
MLPVAPTARIVAGGTTPAAFASASRTLIIVLQSTPVIAGTFAAAGSCSGTLFHHGGGSFDG